MFFSQIIRFERLSTNREDFECRTRYLGNILRQRGYYINTLEKLFSKCIIKYAVEFQKWSLPANTKTWFYNIINNQPTGLIPPVVVSNSFSQPLLGATAVINAQTHFSQPWEIALSFPVCFTVTVFSSWYDRFMNLYALQWQCFCSFPSRQWVLNKFILDFSFMHT